MSFDVYLVEDVATSIDTVRLEGSISSPNYIASIGKSPSALRRNLVKTYNDEITYDFNVMPLKLPASHSSGNVSKSRSLDYDVLVANITEDVKLPYLIMDTGVAAFQVVLNNTSFDFDQEIADDPNLEEEYLGDTTIEYDIVAYDIPDMDLYTELVYNLSYRAASLNRLANVEISNEIGSYSCRGLTDFPFDYDELSFQISSDYQKMYVYISRPITNAETTLFQDVEMFISHGSPDIKANLRIAGSFTYLPALQAFNPTSGTSASIPNTRDYLDSLMRPSYLGYLVEIGFNEAILVNTELVSSDTAEYEVSSMPDYFGRSTFKVYNSVSDLFLGTAVYIQTLGEIGSIETGYINKEDNDSWVTDTTLTTITPEAVRSFFANLGINCRIYTEAGVITKLFLHRLQPLTSQIGELSFRFASSDEITVTNSAIESATFNDLPNSKKVAVTRYTDFAEYLEDEESTVGEYLCTFSLQHESPPKPLSVGICTLTLKDHAALRLSVNTADSYDYSTYSATVNTFDLISDRTSTLSTYGYENTLQTIAQKIATKTSYATTVDTDRGLIYISSGGSLNRNLYIDLKSSSNNVIPIVYNTPDNLRNSIDVKSEGVVLESDSAYFIYMNNENAEVPSVVNNCKTAILDPSKTTSFDIIPFAYAVEDTLVKEQYLYQFNLSSSTFYEDFMRSEAPFFCTVKPIYTNGVKDGRYLVTLNDYSVDSKDLRNLVIRTDANKSGLEDSHKYLEIDVESINGTATITVSPNKSYTFEKTNSVSLNKQYGTSIDYSNHILVSEPTSDGLAVITVANLQGEVEELIIDIEKPIPDEVTAPEEEPVEPPVFDYVEAFTSQVNVSNYLEATVEGSSIKIALKGGLSENIYKLSLTTDNLVTVTSSYLSFTAGETFTVFLDKRGV